MAVYNDWTVEYKNGSTWTEIPNVQDLSCQVGRQTAVEQWPVSQASIRVWYPQGWASPIANLTIGTYIRFFAPGRSSTKPSWTGLVKDLVIEVGIPWDSGTSDGNADFLVIECEGALGKIGRTGVTSVIVGDSNKSGNTRTSSQTACTYAKVGSTVDTSTVPQIKFAWWYDPSLPVYSVFWQDEPIQQINQCAALGNIRVCDGVKSTTSGAGWVTDDPGIYFGGPNGPTTSASFSDTTNDSTRRIYDQITFDGLADLYYDASSISYDNAPPATATATNYATANLGVVPPRTITTQGPPNNQSDYTINYTNQATYLANVYSPADIGISSISATTNGQHTQNLDTLGVTDLELGRLPAYVVPVTLRGTTFYCQIEGVTVTADTNSARFTYYVTPTDTTAWFTLDDSNFGVLDQNRLGIY